MPPGERFADGYSDTLLRLDGFIVASEDFGDYPTLVSPGLMIGRNIAEIPIRTHCRMCRLRDTIVGRHQECRMCCWVLDHYRVGILTSVTADLVRLRLFAPMTDMSLV